MILPLQPHILALSLALRRVHWLHDNCLENRMLTALS